MLNNWHVVRLSQCIKRHIALQRFLWQCAAARKAGPSDSFRATHVIVIVNIAMSTFGSLSDKISFAAEEEKILAHWKEIDAFHTSLKLSENKPEYTFYDGPPFATGLPHYG
jgi:hypothetical protein